MNRHLLIILILIIPAFSQIIRPGFFPIHDDLQTIRQLQMSKCFSDGQVPCRWVPDLGNGFGYPLFNYYPPLPYLVGHIFHLLSFQYLDIVKIVGILGFIFAAIFMYLLATEFWGAKAGIVSAIFYTYAPYHSVDFYVRGAMNEFWALVFFPLILHSIYKVIKSDQFNYWILILAISIAGLLLSHNPMLMIFTPIGLIWGLFWILKTKNPKNIFLLILSGFWGLGIAAFFTLPVLFEQKFVHVETLVIGYFNYLAHFADLRQLFLNINWGYGGSGLGPNDGLSFALGHLHWLVPILVLVLMLLVGRHRKHLTLGLLLFAFTLFALFMSHSKSSFIWSLLKPLEFLQFPWRFLSLAIFSSSFLAGALALISKKLTPFLLALLIFVNYQYFRPREWFANQTDATTFSGSSWKHLITGSIFDYLPKSAPLPPPDSAKSDIELLSGTGSVIRTAKNSNYQAYVIDTTSAISVAQLQTFYFPGWKYFINGRQLLHYDLDALLGRPEFNLSSGKNIVIAKFTNTPVRQVANTISLLSIGVLGLTFLFIRIKHHGS